MFLVDTSAWIFALRKNFFQPLKKRIDNLLMLDMINIFGMVRLEIMGGVKTKKELNSLNNYLGALEEIPADTQLWEDAGRLAFDLRRKGLTIPYTDILIASAAIRSKSVLLHADSHFDIIGQETELQVESYVSCIKNDN